MPQKSSDLICPLCRGMFSASTSEGNPTLVCPHCGGKIKVAGAGSVASDDDDWLKLDDDAESPAVTLAPAVRSTRPARGPHAAATKGSSPVTSVGLGTDGDPLDEFSIPDLPPLMPATSFAGRGPTVGDVPTTIGSVPPLSDRDLDALRGFSNDDEQASAPVKQVKPMALAPGDDFRVRCPICESITYAKVSQVGKKIRCHDCHSTILVPKPPKPKVKYQPDIESAKAFTFQDADGTGDNPRPVDPFRKSAEELLRNAEASVVEQDDDWTVPSLRDWAAGVFGIFRDPMVVGQLVILTGLASVPACVFVVLQNPVLLIGLFVSLLLLSAVVIANGFAILQSVANGEKKVSEWPLIDIIAWMGPLLMTIAALMVASGPVLILGNLVFGVSLTMVTMAMLSIYVLFPFVLLSMLDEESVFVPFSIDVSKSVTRCSEQWGALYLSSGILFFVLFLIFLASAGMPPMMRVVVSIAATIATTFIYFALIGQLAYTIGHAINAPPMVNDRVKNTKMPESTTE